MEDYSNRDSRKYFASGWIGGICFVILYAVAWIVGLQILDWMILVVSIPIYFFVARSAAEKRYQAQQGNAEPLEGVRSTAMGAVAIALIFSVVSAILLQVIGSMFSSYDLAGPATLCWKVPLQCGIAVVMGYFSSQIVINNYK
jgi:ABC-type phosphate transport system permease subunit